MLSSIPDIIPQLEAEILLSFTLGKSRCHLHAWPEKNLNTKQQTLFLERVTRRIQGEPIAYITGQREFWSLELEVTPDTLIPRPETELLVKRALEILPIQAPFQITDLGTGSGAIAAAIASERPHCHILATDSSAVALRVAKANFKRLKLANISTKIGEWCTALPKNSFFELIVSNPPYIPDNDPHLKQGDLPWEPRCALAAGTDGLNDIRHIIRQAPFHLSTGGWLLLEHGYNQGNKIQQLLTKAGFSQIRTLQDLENIDRVTEGKLI